MIRPRADDRVSVLGFVVVALDRRLVDLGPDVLRQNVDVQPVHDRGGFVDAEDQRGVIGRLGLGDVLDVVAVVGLLERPVDDAVEGVRRILGGQRFPVAPLQIRPDLVGPERLVRRLFPGLRKAGFDSEVFGPVHGQRRVGHLKDLVGRDGDPDERIERVDVLHDPDGEYRLGRVVRGAGESGRDENQPHDDRYCGDEAGWSMCHHGPSRLTGGSGRTKYTMNDGFVQEVRRS